MKIEGTISAIVKWEDRKDYDAFKKAKDDGQYDFLFVDKIDSKTIKQHIATPDDFCIPGYGTIFKDGLVIPVKRPHEFKENDKIEINVTIQAKVMV